MAEERPRCWASSFRLMEAEPADGSGAAKFPLALAMEFRGVVWHKGGRRGKRKRKKVRKKLEGQGEK